MFHTKVPGKSFMNREEYRDKVLGCWTGKNIGGTLGAPMEGKRDIFDVTFYTQDLKGHPAPNDDLDLQLVWLRAIEDNGLYRVDERILGEYWLRFITGPWNEYGIGKFNMINGLFPPLSGLCNNGQWKNSNGAWIRSEIWACLFPGEPDEVAPFAWCDACVDHAGDGIYAEIFTAALEAAAFVESDIGKLIEIALARIPADCRVARSVRIAVDEFAAGHDWKTARSRIVEDSADLGWFQAPANVGFVVLGLLYGQGDFKQSLIYAVNCGDDTDCTGATLGSLLGIMGGMAVIPEDWRAYIGDGIKSICLTNGHGPFPQDCTQLTDCLMNLLPVTLRTRHEALIARRVPAVTLGDETIIENVRPEDFYGRDFVQKLSARKPHSYTIEGVYADCLVEFDRMPAIAPGEQLTGRVTLIPHTMPEQKHYRLRFLAPEGWQVDCAKNLFTSAPHSSFRQHASAEFTIHAGEQVDAVNRIVLEIVCAGRPTPLLAPIQIMG